ncbi:MAG: hypothetical protein AAGA85_13345 [Bacteroidota bacterium]
MKRLPILAVMLLSASLLLIHETRAQSQWKTTMSKGNPPPSLDQRLFRGNGLFQRDMSLSQYNRARSAMPSTEMQPNGRYFHSTWVAGLYLNDYDNVRTLGITGEYYLNRDLYFSANVGYRDLEYSGDFVRFLEFELGANYHAVVINNIIFLTALAGINTSTLDMREVETDMPDYRMLVNGVVGGELMVRLSPKWFVFTDFRQMLALNARGSDGLLWLQVWSVGLKRSIKF